MVLFLLVVLASYGVGQWLSHTNSTSSTSVEEKSYDCDPTKETCKIDNNISLEFKGEVSALTPFLVLINSDTDRAESVELIFEMQGMEMGYNHYILVHQNNIWQVQAILPVCSLGRNDWELSVKMKYADKIKISKFKFSQAN